MPLTSVTVMLPASATRPDACTMPSPETLPLAMPIETVAPLPHSELDEAMRTFQEPSNDAAAAGVASGMTQKKRDAGGDNDFAEIGHGVPLLFWCRQSSHIA